MKKGIISIILLLTLTVSVNAQEVLGKIEAFYAKKAMNINVLGRVNPGDMLVGYVTDNEIGYHMENNGNSYYYVDPLIADNEFSVAKANVDAKTYEMNPLPVSIVGQCTYFASRDGLKARIFKSDANGHHYEKIRGEYYRDYVKSMGINLSNCYILSVEYMNDGKRKIFEAPVEVKNGNIMLRGELMWVYYPIVETGRSSYGQDGKLLIDQQCKGGDDVAAAYIGSEKALYFEGKLYYLTDTPSDSASTPAAPQTLDDLPLDEILKLVDQKISAKDLLAKQQYKFAGEYGGGGGYAMNWSRNCICNEQGEVLRFQKGTSSIVGITVAMNDDEADTTLSIEVFNANARDIVLNALNKMGFVVDNTTRDKAYESMNEQGIFDIPEDEWTTFSSKNKQWGKTADVKKSDKGWLFTINPIAAITE